MNAILKTTRNLDNPAVYVGTYAKYNSGSIFGEWVDLTDFADCEDFYTYCRELHSDESDPEIMFQDYENFPESFYSESGLEQSLWDYLDLDDDDQEMLAAYQDSIDGNATASDLDSIRDCYHGKYESEIDYAYEYIDSTGMLSDMPDNIKNYFDYEAFARDIFFEMTFSSGHVFSNF